MFRFYFSYENLGKGVILYRVTHSKLAVEKID